jgi:hypothetical protein
MFPPSAHRFHAAMAMTTQNEDASRLDVAKLPFGCLIRVTEWPAYPVADEVNVSGCDDRMHAVDGPNRWASPNQSVPVAYRNSYDPMGAWVMRRCPPHTNALMMVLPSL